MSIEVMSKQEEDKFLSKLLSKEEDKVRSSSSRVYYCGGATVPFKWESRPGTPKHALFPESSRPTALPLTPPPSYYSTNKNTSIKRTDSKQNQHSLIDSLNLRNTKKQKQKKNRKFSSSFSWSPTTSSYSLSSSSSSSSFSFSLSPVSKRAGRTKMCYGEDEIGGDGGGNSPKTPLCFGSRYRDSKGSFGNSMGRVKKALFSVLGH